MVGDELRPRRFRPDGQQCADLAVYGPLRAVIVVHYVCLLQDDDGHIPRLTQISPTVS